jgi:capsular exopolysaccharide synthesis family protein
LLEAFRSLRTSLHLSARKHGKHCFLFAGAHADDGKSFCAAGYALTLARQGVRTLLIDTDLRSPSLEEMLFKSRNRPGLTDVLEGRISLSDAIVHTSVPRLDFLPAGPLLPEASELLTRKGIETTLENARQRYECLILDSAPVQSVSDPLLLAQAVDSILLIVRYAQTPRKAALRAIQLFEEQGTPVDGIVLNSANPTSLYTYETPVLKPATHSSK